MYIPRYGVEEARERDAPSSKFDMIDAANLADHVGLASLLLSATRHLENVAALFTDITHNASAVNAVAKAICGSV